MSIGKVELQFTIALQFESVCLWMLSQQCSEKGKL